MSINYAILGILSYKSMTGYDLKKVIQDAAFMHWSGNNNQIYKSLTELLNKGLVTNVVQHQDHSPSKKIYTITDEGLAALKDWVLSPSEPNEVKKPFLVQLAWSKQLNTRELNMMLDGYEHQVNMELLVHQNNKQDTTFSPNRTELETAIWKLINDNIRRTYENELMWIQDLRRAITKIPNDMDAKEAEDIKVIQPKEKGNAAMNYAFISNQGLNYVYFNDSETQLSTERNVLDIITACAENDTQFVLFDSDTLSKEFLELKTGLAGTMLQKFTMYHIQSAIVMKDIQNVRSEFKHFVTESGKQDVLRVFSNIGDAEKWFASLM